MRPGARFPGPNRALSEAIWTSISRANADPVRIAAITNLRIAANSSDAELTISPPTSPGLSHASFEALYRARQQLEQSRTSPAGVGVSLRVIIVLTRWWRCRVCGVPLVLAVGFGVVERTVGGV